MKRIGIFFMVVLFFVPSMAFSTLTASAHTAHIVQKNVPGLACSADGCDNLFPHGVTNCLDQGQFFQVFKTSVYDPKGIFLGYEELYRSASCDAYWGTFYYPRFQHAITSIVEDDTFRVTWQNDDNTPSATQGIIFCPCAAGTNYDAPMLGYDGTGPIDGHYASVQVCDNNGCSKTYQTPTDNSH